MSKDQQIENSCSILTNIIRQGQYKEGEQSPLQGDDTRAQGGRSHSGASLPEMWPSR